MLEPKQKGFTIVELLIVIVVIAILAAITIVAFNGVNSKARDAKRAQDMTTIQKALQSYDTLEDGLKTTYSYNPNYNSTNRGGWDASTDDEWLAFLRPRFGNMPTDPRNVLTNNTTSPTSRAYFYYCYPTVGAPTARLIYYKENNTVVDKSFPVNACNS